MKTVIIVDEGRDTLPFNFNNVDVFNLEKKKFFLETATICMVHI